MILKGFTLRSWALKKKYPVTTVYASARGERAGIIAVKISRELEEFAYGS